MKRLQSGYTIIEALIVLSISAVLFVSASTLFHSDKKNIEFSQAVTEFQSKLRSWATDVSTGAFIENSHFNCDTSTGRPSISSAAVTNSNQCIYLGKMIEVIPGTEDGIVSYEMLGKRTDSNGDPVTDPADAQAEPAGQTIGSTFTFAAQYVEQYTLPNGAGIRSVKVGNQENDVLKLYTSLQASSTTSRQISVYALPFSADPNDLPGQSGQDRIRKCGEETLAACATHTDISSSPWKVCLVSNGGNQTAVVSVTPSITGISTSAAYVPCS